MKRKYSSRIFIGIVILALVHFSASGGSPSVISKPAINGRGPEEISFIKTLVEKISKEELRDHILALQNMGTRYAPSRGNLRAADYIKETLASSGIKNVTFDEFSYYDDQTGTYEMTRNVIASKPGIRTPEKIVIIGAHFDSISRSAEDGRISILDKENPAPGADDNGTGVATVLAAARILGPHKFDRTLRFVAFSAEEGGIYGSSHYAAESARKNEDIVAVINIDMIGYVNQEPENIDIFANEKSAWLLDAITNHAPVYAPELFIYRIINDKYDGSDHGPFWYNGYPAICFMEDYYPSNQFYHSPKDTLDTINFPFFLNTVRLAVAGLAELAGIHVQDKPAVPFAMISRDIGLKAVNWKTDSGKKFLFTISPSSNQANIIDVSLPRISSCDGVPLGDLTPEVWGESRDLPVAAVQKPAGKLIYVSMIKLRAPAKESEQGTVRIVDPEKKRVVGSFPVNRFPTAGCFNSAGTKFYQPYWGEKFIDVFDTASLKRIDRIPTPFPLSQLSVDTEEKRAIGISPETHSIVIINVADKRMEKVFHKISAPKDVILVNDELALVCSYDQARIFSIDMGRKEILGEIPVSPRPVRLILSPQKDLVVSLHQLSPKVDLFHLIPSQGRGQPTMERKKVMDLGEVITDGTFAEDLRCYFVSSGKKRLLGLDLSNEKVFWGMRTGGVRGRADVEKILFIRDK